MKVSVTDLRKKLDKGIVLNKEELMVLKDAGLDEMISAADEIRERYCGNRFGICCIANAKSGKCTEDCAYCAQSSHWKTDIDISPLIEVADAVRQAEDASSRGVMRFALVSSGRKLNDIELERIAESIRAIKEALPEMTVCASLGMLDKDEFLVLKEAGLERVHNNMETSRRYFPEICTTHSYDDKLDSIKAAREAGLEVCSGGIFGIGESFEDRIDLALQIREIGAVSVPLNFLNPIPGTPMEGKDSLPFDEVLRTVAMFRFAIPQAFIRLAGGRTLLENTGAACWKAGANAVISGDMLTTSGYSFESDMEMAESMGYEVGAA